VGTESAPYLSGQAEDRSWRFWLWSVIGHVGVGAILLLTPAKDFILTKPAQDKDRPPMRIRDAELEKFVEELRDQTAEEIRGRVTLLQAGQERMATNFDTLHKHFFKGFEDLQRQSARARMETYMRDTLDRLKRLLDTCDKALAEKRSEDMIRQYNENIAKILAGMEELERGFRLVDDLQNLVPTQRKILDGQHTASQFHRYHEDAIQWRGRLEEEIASSRRQLGEAEEKVRQLEPEAATLEAKAKAQTDALAALQKALADARAKKDAAGIRGLVPPGVGLSHQTAPGRSFPLIFRGEFMGYPGNLGQPAAEGRGDHPAAAEGGRGPDGDPRRRVERLHRAVHQHEELRGDPAGLGALARPGPVCHLELGSDKGRTV